jgi:hypothetical protein
LHSITPVTKRVAGHEPKQLAVTANEMPTNQTAYTRSRRHFQADGIKVDHKETAGGNAARSFNTVAYLVQTR